MGDRVKFKNHFTGNVAVETEVKQRYRKECTVTSIESCANPRGCFLYRKDICPGRVGLDEHAPECFSWDLDIYALTPVSGRFNEHRNKLLTPM